MAACCSTTTRASRSVADWCRLADGSTSRCSASTSPTTSLVGRLAAPRSSSPCGSAPLPAPVLARLPELRLLVTTGMRNASIDLAAGRGAGRHRLRHRRALPPPAELTWALILGLRPPRGRRSGRACARGGWQQTVGDRPDGGTLGLVGLGTDRPAVAAVGRAFGMDVIAWSQNLTAERAADAGVRLVGKEELFAAADVVTIHLVLSDRTRGLVGRVGSWRDAAHGVPGQHLARGPIVDEAPWSRAPPGRIAGAGLDVFDVEPLPADTAPSALRAVLATPHLGYVTRATTRCSSRGRSRTSPPGWPRALSGAPVEPTRRRRARRRGARRQRRRRSRSGPGRSAS